MSAAQENSGGINLRTKFLAAGVAGCSLGVMGLISGVTNDDPRPLLGWLLGLGFWLSIGVGMLMLIMLFRVFNSGWGVVLRRQFEHCLHAFPLLAACFVPLLLIAWFGGEKTGLLWEWINPHNVLPGEETVGEDILYQKKSGFLNVVFFSVRAILYFGIFCGLSHWLRKCSFEQDKDGDPKWTRLGHNISAGGIALTALALTFAAFDWFMSLEYHWFSTMFGVWFFAASMRAALAVAIILCFLQSTRGRLQGIYNQAHRYDLACLSLTFTIFWAYISFSQYFLIYNANIPEETFWYQIREIDPNTGEKISWWWVSMGLVFCHFLIPFLYLLWYRNKIDLKRILIAACWILAFHLLDMYWNLIPGREASEVATLGYVPRSFTITLWDVASIVGIGGFCCWRYLQSLDQTEVEDIPVRDPRILESIHHHE
ncbi:MAG: hypothetical protein CMI32_02540 [Opitutales bacterium]|nr:hypothetical protein [Opitutales bacterium]